MFGRKVFELFGRKQPKRRPTFRPQIEQLEERETPTVNLLGSITGLNNTGTYPPDTQIAVGTTYAVETVNQSLAIYNKSTMAKYSSEGLNILFSGYYYGSQGFFDAQVVYDDIADRYVIAAATTSSVSSTGNLHYTAFIDFAVSKTSDPTQGWTIQQVEVDQGGTNWVDNGKLGYNADGWIYSGNRYGQGGYITTNGSAVLTVDKSSITNPTWTSYLVDISGFSTVPARMHGAASGGPEWLVESIYYGGSSVDVLKMTNVLSSNPTFTTTDIQNISSYSPATVTQYNGNQIIFPNSNPPDTYDSRTESVEWNNNNLVAAWNSQVGSDAAAYWIEFTTGGSNPAFMQQGVIHPGNGISTSIPAVAVDARGDIGMTYIQSSSTQYPSVYITGRLAWDNLGTMEASQRVQPGSANLVNGRIGDYAAVGLDPSASNTFWGANEYGSSTGGTYQWGTAVGEFSVTSSGTASPTDLGVFDAASGTWVFLNSYFEQYAGNTVSFGGGNQWQPVYGNWFGSGKTDLGVFNPATGQWILMNDAFQQVQSVYLGGGNQWQPVVGSWFGTGRTDLGVFNPSSGQWVLMNDAFQQTVSVYLGGGNQWQPVVGNWYGTTHTDIGVFNPSAGQWALMNDAYVQQPIINFGGGPYTVPVVGNWFGTGTTDLGVFDPTDGIWVLMNNSFQQQPAIYFGGGNQWEAVVGDWFGTGYTDLGLFDPATGEWVLMNSAFQQVEFIYNFGGGNQWQPVVGNWP